MLPAAVELLACRAGGRYVDGTLGGGGYTEAILRAIAPDGMLLALDWDAEAIARVKDKLQPYSNQLIVKHANYASLPQILKEIGWDVVDGVAIDLGVSSFQLSDPLRGFSFIQGGPLDMRMDQNQERTAADIVNLYSEAELADLISRLGEERWARRIARAIVTRRKENPFSNTLELADLIRSVVPKTKDSRRIHPATRTFQALRIAVNKELESLDTFLSQVLDVLKPGGRLCIVAFHSLEDRLVKERFKDWAKTCRCPKDQWECRCEGRPLVKLLTKKALRPSEEEIERNPRARSARLRAVEKR